MTFYSEPHPSLQKSNRLIHEKSPYLLQHAHNPVDWYPWDEEALQLAKKLNKPIFLSIGYSTCHWCHVMAHESFEDHEIAKIMNKHFINIKVDREERPDLDALYMAAVQMLTGSGGWPMSVWLTPHLKPFYGGTYFPPEDRYGRAGFKSVLIQLGEIWDKENHKALESSNEIFSLINPISITISKSKAKEIEPKKIFELAYKLLKSTFDERNGGFGPAPKFPMPVHLDFLLTYYARTNDKKALDMASFTMEKMVRGGIYDQLGGGFSRYSTDDKWTVPHFEKMLYDNAQLINTCVSLYQITHNNFFQKTTDHALTYLFRDMQHSGGAFFSAEDADSEGKEGAFYLWTLAEIKNILGKEEGDWFCYRYGATTQGNFVDPHTRETGKNVLTQTHTLEETSYHFGKPIDQVSEILSQSENKLLAYRTKRPRPSLDDKILTGWNGLMISTLARAGLVFNKNDYLLAAAKTAQFLEKNLFENISSELFRRWRDGDRRITAHQSDYAYLVQGLLDLFEATSDPHWLTWASQLHQTHNQLFYDEIVGNYFMTVKREDLLFRIKDDHDNVIPSGNSIAALNGLRLHALLNQNEFLEKANRTLKSFGESFENYASSFSKMLTALDLSERGHFLVVILGPHDQTETQQMIKGVLDEFIPNKIMISVDPTKNHKELGEILPMLSSMTMIQEKPTAYLCQYFSCLKPLVDPRELKKEISRLAKRN